MAWVLRPDVTRFEQYELAYLSYDGPNISLESSEYVQDFNGRPFESQVFLLSFSTSDSRSFGEKGKIRPDRA